MTTETGFKLGLEIQKVAIQFFKVGFCEGYIKGQGIDVKKGVAGAKKRAKILIRLENDMRTKFEELFERGHKDGNKNNKDTRS